MFLVCACVSRKCVLAVNIDGIAEDLDADVSSVLGDCELQRQFSLVVKFAFHFSEAGLFQEVPREAFVPVKIYIGVVLLLELQEAA